jgi:anti-sigma-K factor RskA
MMTKNEIEREEIETLLPWHAAGTLSRRDAQRVETALEQDQDLARQFEQVRAELGETNHLNDTLGAASARKPS